MCFGAKNLRRCDDPIKTRLAIPPHLGAFNRVEAGEQHGFPGMKSSDDEWLSLLSSLCACKDKKEGGARLIPLGLKNFDNAEMWLDYEAPIRGSYVREWWWEAGGPEEPVGVVEETGPAPAKAAVDAVIGEELIQGLIKSRLRGAADIGGSTRSLGSQIGGEGDRQLLR